MMDSNWRPDGWGKTKSQIRSGELRVRELMGVVMEYSATEILKAYFESNEFAEDASEYCRERGWKEPD